MLPFAPKLDRRRDLHEPVARVIASAALDVHMVKSPRGGHLRWRPILVRLLYALSSASCQSRRHLGVRARDDETNATRALPREAGSGSMQNAQLPNMGVVDQRRG
jgi:hypothetical protein